MPLVQPVAAHRRGGAPHDAARAEVDRQKAVDEVLALGEDLLALGAVDHAHADFFVDAVGAAVGVLRDGGVAGRRVQAEHEDLLFIDVATTPARQRFNDGGAAGVEAEMVFAHQRLACEVLGVRLERELAGHAGRQVAHEIVAPVVTVYPAAGALFRTIDAERVAQTQVAEGHHLVAEARLYLSHLLDGAARRKRIDGGLRARRQRQQTQGNQADDDQPGVR